MKRNEIIKKLLKEGFTEKTLIGLNDKQIITLSKTMFSEQEVKGAVIMKKQTTPPTDVKKMTDTGVNVELREKKLNKKKKKEDDIPYDEDSDKDDIFPTGSSDWRKKKKKEDKDINETKKWIEKLVENKYHSITTKNEIMELISTKLTQLDENQPATKPNPGTSPTETPTRPSTKPGKPKRENPFEPKHNPRPKAKLPKFMQFKNIGIRLKDEK